MQRLTTKRDWEEASKDLKHELGYSYIWKRLNEIEDILGDEYDINRLRELLEADRNGRCVVLPVLRYRPERYKWYEATGLNENGEPLYVKRVRIDEKSWAMYCPACGKRLCSRFNNYCPHCGAKMDGGKSNGKT